MEFAKIATWDTKAYVLSFLKIDMGHRTPVKGSMYIPIPITDLDRALDP